MPECVANVFQGCAIYAGILKSKVSKPPHIIHPVGCAPFFLFPFLLSPFPPPFTVPFPFSFSILLSLVPSPFSFPHSPFLLSPFPFSFPSFFPFLLSPYFSPFCLLLSLLLALSLYKWNAAVTYRWRNPQSWFHEEKSCSLSLSLSPFSFPSSFPSSFHCPFPFLLSPSPFPFPFPFSLPHFPFPFSCPRWLRHLFRNLVVKKSFPRKTFVEHTRPLLFQRFDDRNVQSRKKGFKLKMG